MDQEFWKQQPKTVARQLLGKAFVCGPIEGTILGAVGYSRSENSSGIYAPVLKMAPGQVYCPRRRNAVLLLIVTQDGPSTGGCVLIRSIETGGQIYDGPGRVTSALGILDARTLGDAELTDEDRVIVRLGSVLNPIRPEARTRRNLIGNEIGKETLTRLMPRIIAKYIREKPGLKFGEYLNKLLEGCGSKSEFLKKLH